MAGQRVEVTLACGLLAMHQRHYLTARCFPLPIGEYEGNPDIQDPNRDPGDSELT